MFLVLISCRAAEPPPPPPKTRADAHEARLRAAFDAPGVWTGPTGTLEITPRRTVKLAFRACAYPDLAPARADGSRPSGCVPQEAELSLLGIEGPYVVLHQPDPGMPLFAPTWLDAAGVLHLGPFLSNRAGAAAVDDAGRGEYPFTPAHRLTVEPGPVCAWDDQLGHSRASIPCTATADGAATRIRFTVPPGGFGPWEGDHGVVWVPADGILMDPELEVVTFTRR